MTFKTFNLLFVAMVLFASMAFATPPPFADVREGDSGAQRHRLNGVQLDVQRGGAAPVVAGTNQPFLCERQASIRLRAQDWETCAIMLMQWPDAPLDAGNGP